MLKRYIVFAWRLEYDCGMVWNDACGGWNDVLRGQANDILSYDTWQEAAEATKHEASEYTNVHIVDLRDGKLIVVKEYV